MSLYLLVCTLSVPYRYSTHPTWSNTSVTAAGLSQLTMAWEFCTPKGMRIPESGQSSFHPMPAFMGSLIRREPSMGMCMSLDYSESTNVFVQWSVCVATGSGSDYLTKTHWFTVIIYFHVLDNYFFLEYLPHICQTYIN